MLCINDQGRHVWLTLPPRFTDTALCVCQKVIHVSSGIDCCHWIGIPEDTYCRYNMSEPGYILAVI